MEKRFWTKWLCSIELFFLLIVFNIIYIWRRVVSTISLISYLSFHSSQYFSLFFLDLLSCAKEPPWNSRFHRNWRKSLHHHCPHIFYHHCRNSFMASAPTPCTATAVTPSPLLPQPFHRRCRNSLHRHASFFAYSHRNSLHDHRYNSVYHYFDSAHFSSAISTVASYTTNFIKFIANRKSVLSFQVFCYWIFTFIMQWNIWRFLIFVII